MHKARAPCLAKIQGQEALRLPLEEFVKDLSSRSRNETWHLKEDKDGNLLISWDRDVIPVLEAIKLADLEELLKNSDVNYIVHKLVEAYGPDGSNDKPKQTKLFDVLREHVFFASHRLSVVPEAQQRAAANMDWAEDENCLRLQVDKKTLWRISVDTQKNLVMLQSSFDTEGFSRDCGQQALADKCSATLLHPAGMTQDRAGKLNSKRQPVFMGVGPKRERELILCSSMSMPHLLFAQIKPDEWDKVAKANPQLNIPLYDEVHEMSDITPYYSEVKLMSSSNIANCGVGDGKVPFGKKTMEPVTVGVAFSSGVRLERQIFTDYHRVFENSSINSFLEGAFKEEAYAELMRRRFEPLFRHNPRGKYWFTPVGLGIYAEAVPSGDKDAMMRSWIRETLQKSI